ncbi:MAG TPA: lysyl oxidase family protein [Chloroflexota bacterium]|nr:lysyl oxidase family protein [Chloroflexota bacterium]
MRLPSLPFFRLLFVMLALLLWLAACQQEPDTIPTAQPRASKTPAEAGALATAAPTRTATTRATAVAWIRGTAVTPSPESPPTLTPPPTLAASPANPAISPTPAASPDDRITSSPTGQPGALIRLNMNSRVGVLLDEIPQESRDRVATTLLQKPDDYWQELARQQVQLTYNRLHFRPFFYEMLKGQLPLPPESVWEISLGEDGPRRTTVGGHDYVLIDYAFSSVLLTDPESPGKAEFLLGQEGGKWTEPFVLPGDPHLLIQRTDNACINESGFPPNGYDSENVAFFYDYTCTADSGGPLGCHRSRLPTLSCLEALGARVGMVETGMQFERLPWAADLADEVRVAQVLSFGAPNLTVVGDELQYNRIIYQYFPPNSCAAQEACINGDGWRRLLQFDAMVHNLGTEALNIGRVIRSNPLNTMFQYNSCHDHYHFANFGEFQLGVNNQPSKQAFCVESTSRLSNNELSPLTHDFTCNNQGIQAGWVDEYQAGLDCQWIDITDLEFESDTLTMPLIFRFNQNGFLCEGQPVLNENGELMWEPTGERTAEGLPISRPQCEFVEGWDSNNEGSHELLIPAVGSFVTAPCTQGQIGPLRNCGFSLQPLAPLPTPTPADDEEAEAPLRCTPGQTVQLSCSIPADAQPQTLRICETSAALGVGTACTFETAMVNRVIGPDGRDISFTCPFPRDENEPGGDYAFYVAPVFPEDALAQVSCTAVTP